MSVRGITVVKKYWFRVMTELSLNIRFVSF